MTSFQSLSKKQLAVLVLMSAISGAVVGMVCTVACGFDAGITGGIAGGIAAVLGNAYLQKSSGD